MFLSAATRKSSGGITSPPSTSRGLSGNPYAENCSDSHGGSPGRRACLIRPSHPCVSKGKTWSGRRKERRRTGPPRGRTTSRAVRLPLASGTPARTQEGSGLGRPDTTGPGRSPRLRRRWQPPPAPRPRSRATPAGLPDAAALIRASTFVGGPDVPQGRPLHIRHKARIPRLVPHPEGGPTKEPTAASGRDPSREAAGEAFPTGTNHGWKVRLTRGDDASTPMPFLSHMPVMPG